MATSPAAAANTTAAIATQPAIAMPPAIPPSAPSSVNVRIPPKRASGPVACPDHCRSRPTAAPPSTAIARPLSGITSRILTPRQELADFNQRDGHEAEHRGHEQVAGPQPLDREDRPHGRH